jgi:hypothetical protein
LFPFDGIKGVAYLLESLTEYIKDFGITKGYTNFIKYYLAWGEEDATNLGILVSLVGGEKELKLLAKTISDLKQIAKSKGYILDLHDGNFLLGGDGEIVINDPFHVSGSY